MKRSMAHSKINPYKASGGILTRSFTIIETPMTSHNLQFNKLQVLFICRCLENNYKVIPMNRQLRALKTRSWACKSLKSRLIKRLLSAESFRSTEVPGGDGSLPQLNNEAGRSMKSSCILFLSAGISILPTVEATIFSANLQPLHFCTMREVYPHLLLECTAC